MLRKNKIALLICFLFFIAYALLSIIRHNHFGSYGFDLGIADQTVWKYSQFKQPITTIDHIPFVSELSVHLEFIYFLLAPFYWIYSNVIFLLLLQVNAITFSGFAIFLLAKKHKLNQFISCALLISYLMFYGVQNAIWFDVHSTVFGTSFLAWFIYFLDNKNFRFSLITFFLVISCKENYAGMTFLISLVYLIYRREKRQLLFIGLSCLYLLVVFGFYFPNMGGYRFQSKQGLLGGISLFDFINTSEKIQVIGYTFAWTSLLSLLQPLFLIPIIGNLASYFILGREVSTAQGLFLQYRIELAPLLFLATIYGIKKIRVFNTVWIGIYLLLCAVVFQYMLHLPLSYVTKQWFWKEPASVKNINTVITFLPKNASVVAQNNIVPHISNRDNIFILYPTTRDFISNSPCGNKNCNWLSWIGNAKFLLVDISTDWDERGFLINRESFIDGLKNLEKYNVIIKHKQIGNSVLYKVFKKP